MPVDQNLNQSAGMQCGKGTGEALRSLEVLKRGTQLVWGRVQGM